MKSISPIIGIEVFTKARSRIKCAMHHRPLFVINSKDGKRYRCATVGCGAH
jgi:hypothetical protein